MLAKDIKIGQPFSVSGHKLSETLPRDWEAQQCIAVPVTIKLKEDYIAELRSTLERLATERTSSLITSQYTARDATNDFKKSLSRKLVGTTKEDGIFINLYSNSYETWTITSYFIPKIRSRFKKRYEFRNDLSFQHRKLQASFNDQNNTGVIQAVFGIPEGRENELFYSIKENIMISRNTRAPQQRHPYQLANGGMFDGYINIYPESNFFIIAETTPEQLLG